MNKRFAALVVVGACTIVSVFYFLSCVPIMIYIEGSVVSVAGSGDITKIVLDTNADVEYLLISRDMKLNPGIGDYIHLEYNHSLFVTSGYRINQLII